MRKKVPYEFIFEMLEPLPIEVKPMFGCHAAYLANKILFIVRKKEDHLDSNGIWIATSRDHHSSLKEELPTLYSVPVLSNGKGETNWQMIHNEDADFEESAVKMVELIKHGDDRIGRIPKPRKKKIKKRV